MSLRRSKAALVIKLHRSRQMLVLIALMHGLALLLFWPLDERLGLFVLPLIPALLISLVMSTRRYALLTGRRAVTKIIVKGSNEYVLAMSDGRYVPAVLRCGSYVQPLLIILNFKVRRWPWYVSVPLLPDSADADILRQLRVRLRTMRDGELETLA